MIINDVMDVINGIGKSRNERDDRIRRQCADIAREVELNALRAGKKEIADAAKAIAAAIMKQPNADSDSLL